MRLQRVRLAGLSWVAAIALAFSHSGTMANVNVELRAPRPFVFVGRTIDVGLYIASDDDTAYSVSGLDAIMIWDSTALSFEQKLDNSPYNWFLSTFGNDRALDRLNADCGPDLFCDQFTSFPFNDGDALYSVVARATPAPAPAEGLLVVTFVFRGDAVSPGASLVLLPDFGDFSHTRVLNGDPLALGEVITGTLDSLEIPVVECGTHGDFDADCEVTMADFALFADCLTGPDGAGLEPGCEAADLDDDGDSDLRDIAMFQAAFAAP